MAQAMLCRVGHLLAALTLPLSFSSSISRSTGTDQSTDAIGAGSPSLNLKGILDKGTRDEVSEVLQKFGDYSAGGGGSVKDQDVRTALDQMLAPAPSRDADDDAEAAARARMEAAFDAEEKANEQVEDTKKRVDEWDREAAEQRAQAEAEKKRREVQAAESRERLEKQKAQYKAEEEALRMKNEQQLNQMRAARDRTKEMMSSVNKHAFGLLQEAHAGLENVSDSASDASFWDDFFKNATSQAAWRTLGYSHLEPALIFSGFRPQQRVLVYESRALNRAWDIAEGLQNHGATSVTTALYGAEVSGPFDVVIELGLLDAVAMGGASQTKSIRVAETRKVIDSIRSLVRPSGTWMSVSVVPPSLRVQLLRALTIGAFAPPKQPYNEKNGVYTVLFRGDGSSGPENDINVNKQMVNNVLLYGTVESKAYAYCLKREVRKDGQPKPAASGGFIEWLIGAQRPWRSSDHDEI
eukprot:gnl/MRDRNA2_/MRDRNA2_115936_c0_seq1.p1 gnl/MRDRNA2_/MRDRNA2_115936_c0~~gnl/MRDRNA2_/MRDRNA2_115936_c0_seq1.p1  ORF type:complete len:467 (+),score=110.06 gnl/MRDRNA2_/MRDRNA2_115936_c0_seq1:67-1467(+)